MRLVNDRVTDHFRLSEFACSGEMIVTPEFISFVQALEVFRKWYNRPININSGYRSSAKNKAVGGVPSSLHMRAMAVDFNLPADYMQGSNDRKKEFANNVIKKWSDVCRSIGGYSQICWYDGYVHLGLSWNNPYFEDKRRNKAWKI